MILLEREHISFEHWLVKLLRLGILPTTFNLIQMQAEYLALCWKEEELWQKWSENANKG